MEMNAEETCTWGEWKLLVPENLLEHKSGYRVDFNMLGTAAGMLDIIFQVERKFSAAAVGQLVTALADIFDPQDSLCCDGEDHPFDAEEHFRERLATGFTRSRRAERGLNLWFGEADRPAGIPN